MSLVDLERKAYLTKSQAEERRKAIDADRWLFVKWVCGHGSEDFERFHRPLTYFLAGDARRLAASLNIYKSEVVTQIRADLARRGIDWNTAAGLRALQKLLRRVNNRISRSMGKTTLELDVLAGEASVDPNVNIGIASKSDPAAWGMCQTIGNIVRSDLYAMYYADRLFSKASGHGFDYDSYITNKWIRLNGRTRPEQETIEARGVTSQWYSKHYNIIAGDDLSSTEAKQGEATVEDAIRFLASLHGLSVSERFGGTRYIFSGTIQGAKDDNAALMANPEFISIRVPIWVHAGPDGKPDGVPWTLANMRDDGAPTLPEFYDVDACKQKREDTLANSKLGAISWLQNFLLCAAEEGSMQFSADLINRAKFVWVTRAISTNHGQIPKRVIRRYLWNADGSPKTDAALARLRTADQCRCWVGCGLQNHAYVEFDPLDLTRVIGVDQALALHGDKWAIAPVAQDPFGVAYKLKGAAERGYRLMIPAIPMVFKKWGGVANPPRKVGIESNAWQAITADWMQRDDAFRFLARRIVKVSPGITQKEIRIFNNVLANLEMGTLMIDPDDSDFIDEALKYNAADENPEDNVLDATAIAMTLLGRPEDEFTERERLADERRAEADWMSTHDPMTGIDTTDWVSEVM